MTRTLRIAVVLLLALTLAACATTRRGRGTPPGFSFFGDEADLLTEGEKQGDWAYIYRNPETRFEEYDEIIVDPIGFWVDPDKVKLNATDRQRLANNFYAIAYRVMSQYFKVVDEPTPGKKTLRIRIGLTNAEASRVVLDAISTIVPQLRVGTKLTSYVSGKPAFTGRSAFMFRVMDAQAARTVAMGADARVGERTISGLTDKWSDVTEAFEYWAEVGAYRICTEKKQPNCERPKVKRAL